MSLQSQSVFLCIDPKCEQNLLITSTEEFARHSHQSHKTVDLNEFKKEYGHLVSTAMAESHNRFLFEFQQLKNKLSKQVISFCDELVRILCFFDNELQDYLKQIEEKDFNFSPQDQSRLREIWLRGPKSQAIDIKQSKILLSQCLKEFNQQLVKIIEEAKLQPLIIQRLPAQPIQYEFSSTLKHHRFTIIQDQQANSILTSGQGGNTLCLLSPPFNDLSGVQKFGFRWRKTISDELAIGVCHLETVKNKVWDWDKNIGGGTYMIDNRGRVYSNWDINQSGQGLGFEYQVNDKIYCYYDSYDQTLIIKKSDQKIEMRLRLTKGEQIHPCIMMAGTNEVELIKYKDIPELK